MKKTVVLLYPQFSEYELSVALSILMQGGKQVITAAASREPVHGEAGLVCLPDAAVDEVDLEEIDSLLLTGCMDVLALQGEVKLFNFIQRAEPHAEVIASISSSPYLLAKAGVLDGVRYTVGMTEENRELSGVFQKENYSDDLVVLDGKFITARGRGFIRFGEYLGKALALDFDSRWYME